MKYRTILADPPWVMGKFGKGKDPRPGRVYKLGEVVKLSYPTMSVDEICALKVQNLADDNSHLWLWATNHNLHDAFHVMDAWGFRYHGIITWYKAAGVGAYLINKTQHLLLGYRGKFYVNETGRYIPTIQHFRPERNSAKPTQSYELIENFSYGPYLELFARKRRENWHVWGNEVESDVVL